MYTFKDIYGLYENIFNLYRGSIKSQGEMHTLFTFEINEIIIIVIIILQLNQLNYVTQSQNIF